MNNKEQVTILKEGVKEWNIWREENRRESVELSGLDLSGADLSRANLREANLSDAILHGAYLSGANLSRADLSRASVSRVNLTWTDLSLANLSGTDLSWTDLTVANLSGANLSRANLSRADLSSADLSKANLSKANLSWVRLHGTVFANVDLSQVRGLDTVRHRGPSTIGIDTLYRSAGNIPESFLRGAGIPETFITFSKSLVGQAIEFYSAFISYSSHNQSFAERLHADLRQKQVRVWYAPEDLKIGDKIRTGIDQAIRVHDKLLLILSEESINSDWVEQEVETALEKERESRKLVLFPIRLDDSVFAVKAGWAANVKRRHIGDFCRWKDHDTYQQAFQRLLHDLNAKS